MSDVPELDAVVVGGGVIGLAIARELALKGRHVTVLEAEPTLGAHSSSRNSEVIHAGIYYPEGSLKARLCVAGRTLLYAYCEREGVNHARTGKLIVATSDDQIPTLEGILQHAQASGVHDLRWLDATDVHALEPAVTAVRGLLSPSTGIVDSHGLMAAFKRDAVHAGADIVLDSPVLAGKVNDLGIELEIGGAEPTRVRCATLVNAAGLRAQNFARSLAGFPAGTIPQQYFAKGHYFVLNGRSPFTHLVYPVPVSGGLGVHVTLDLAGRARFGPDVSWVPEVSYDFDEERAASFCAAIRRYYPGLREDGLSPGYTGVRPKLGPPGSPAQDFELHGPGVHGVPGVLHLYGIESPGLTASLALAQHAVECLG
ncbi:MAG TPA: NAD(P)/FAD-dependent oxidoreductase [Vicinamibacterales bacterium]|nr:NAD(P)/FAD-dependent oxidoreductase [Vicinamibacterales bacterium]